MNETLTPSAAQMRSRIARRAAEPHHFRAALLGVPPRDRDAWVDAVVGLGEVFDDGPDLPLGCVPYLPCPVEALLRMVDAANVQASDVFVDLGAGPGRATALVHLLTGAEVVGVEIQMSLDRAARALLRRLKLERARCIRGDAAALPPGSLECGSVFFLYCPFSGDRLARVLADLEPIARRREVRLCTVDLPLPPRPWLATNAGSSPGGLEVYRSR